MNSTTAENLYNLSHQYMFKDDIKARDLLLEAARQGHIEAQFEMGEAHDTHQSSPFLGIVIRKNNIYAREWYAMAARQGHTEAQRRLEDNDYWKDGCYIATCVYGSYDSPEVWTLRQFRDNELSNLWLGRQFIRIYYAVSPKIVELFGNKKWFSKLWKPIIDKIVCKLQRNG